MYQLIIFKIIWTNVINIKNIKLEKLSLINYLPELWLPDKKHPTMAIVVVSVRHIESK